MHKGILVYLIILIAIAVIGYIEIRGTNFAFFSFLKSSTSTTTIKPNVTQPNYSRSTTISYQSTCNGFSLYNNTPNYSVAAYCTWSGGTLGVWLASGTKNSIHVSIKGLSTNVTYINSTSSYGCTLFYSNFTAPAQKYLVTIKTGNSTVPSKCPTSIVILNTTTKAPYMVYPFIYNGNFSTGTYTGWNVSGIGFGAYPSNISVLNEKGCYPGKPWNNNSVGNAASTLNCNLVHNYGNLTSYPFKVSKAFINFQVVSTDDPYAYVELLVNGTPYESVYFDTVNISTASSQASKFMNASIPVINLTGKVVQIRVVTQIESFLNYIAVTNFRMSNRPNLAPGIIVKTKMFNQS